MIELSDLLASGSASALHAGPSTFEKAAINSKDVSGGDLFFALPGKSRDGHDFVPDAVRAGAGGVVVAREIPAVPAGVTVVRVPDTVEALQNLGAATRRRSTASVTAVTGSAGKTTTKSMVACVLGSRFGVLSSRASFNNHLGVPLTLLEIGPEHSHVVAEVGTNHRGEIDRLARLVEPDVGMVTNIGFAHIGNFRSREELADEKTDLLRRVRPGGLWVLNGDDELLLAAAGRIPSREDAAGVVRVGFGTGNDIRAADVHVDESGTTGKIVSGGGVTPFSLAVPGRHFVYAALFAIAVGQRYGIDVTDAVEALRGHVAPRGRATVLRLAPDLLVMDDSYNASPDSMLAALDLLGGMSAAVKIAVLGEMRELGDASARLHELIGERVPSTATHLVAVGPGCGALVARARREGFNPARIWQASSAQHAYTVTKEIVAGAEGSCAVLVKGSRFTHMERVRLGLSGTAVGCALDVCPLYINCSECPKLETG